VSRTTARKKKRSVDPKGAAIQEKVEGFDLSGLPKGVTSRAREGRRKTNALRGETKKGGNDLCGKRVSLQKPGLSVVFQVQG